MHARPRPYCAASLLLWSRPEITALFPRLTCSADRASAFLFGLLILTFAYTAYLYLLILIRLTYRPSAYLLRRSPVASSCRLSASRSAKSSSAGPARPQCHTRTAHVQQVCLCCKPPRFASIACSVLLKAGSMLSAAHLPGPLASSPVSAVGRRLPTAETPSCAHTPHATRRSTHPPSCASPLVAPPNTTGKLLQNSQARHPPRACPTSPHPTHIKTQAQSPLSPIPSKPWPAATHLVQTGQRRASWVWGAALAGVRRPRVRLAAAGRGCARRSGHR
jgi:hypothetical protein